MSAIVKRSELLSNIQFTALQARDLYINVLQENYDTADSIIDFFDDFVTDHLEYINDLYDKIEELKNELESIELMEGSEENDH